MYEIGAVEVAPLRIDFPGQRADEPVLSAADLRPLEAIEDELMPFEFAARRAARESGQMNLGIPGTNAEPELTGASRRREKKAKPGTVDPTGG